MKKKIFALGCLFVMAAFLLVECKKRKRQQLTNTSLLKTVLWLPKKCQQPVLM